MDFASTPIVRSRKSKGDFSNEKRQWEKYKVEMVSLAIDQYNLHLNHHWYGVGSELYRLHLRIHCKLA